MREQAKAERRNYATEDVAPKAKYREESDKVKADTDDILDAIDAALEENERFRELLDDSDLLDEIDALLDEQGLSDEAEAQEFVAGFTQARGE